MSEIFRTGLKVTPSDERLFVRAASLALWGEHNRVRVGAVLTKSGRELGSGFNVHRNPIANVPHGFVTVHAERQAIRGVAKSKCTLYVARLGLNGEAYPSWPCEDCLEHVIACECVSKIVFFDGHAVVKVRL